MRIQYEVGVPRDRETVHGKRVEHLSSLDLIGGRPLSSELGDAVGHVENEDNEQAVRGALDFEVAEQRVGSKEIECLVYYVRLVRIG